MREQEIDRRRKLATSRIGAMRISMEINPNTGRFGPRYAPKLGTSWFVEPGSPLYWSAREAREAAKRIREECRAWLKERELGYGTGEQGESDVSEPGAKSQSLLDAAENVVIAYGMAWNMEGVIENLCAAIDRERVKAEEAVEVSAQKEDAA